MRNETAECIVVGLGAVGSAVLDQLATRGIRVLGLDRFAPPHAFGSSHGTSRITRQAVGEGERYVGFVRKSHEVWTELEEETGARLFLKTGCLTIGTASRPSKPDFVRTALAVAQRHAIDVVALGDGELRARYPQFVIADGTTGFLETNAGVLFPEACVRAQLERAKRCGAAIACDVAFHHLERDGAGVAVVATNGERYVAPHVVLATGAWLPAHVGAAFADVKVERQVRYTFAPDPASSPLWHADRCPAYIRLDRADEHHSYGFPELPGMTGVTMAIEQHQTSLDPEGYDRAVPPAERDGFFRRFVEESFAGLTSHCIEAGACLYTTTPSGHFVIDRHPDFADVTVVSACSGHGFKHCAGVGAYVADHLAGPFDPAFSIRNALLSPGP